VTEKHEQRFWPFWSASGLSPLLEDLLMRKAAQTVQQNEFFSND
jgi:hypothetical protein